MASSFIGDAVEDLTGLGKIADSALANRVYDDGFAKVTRETGDALSDVMKSFRLFMAPFQFMALAQERLSRFCERARSAVPAERQIDASPSIAGPVLLELRHQEEQSRIADLYVNLLRRAIDRDRQEEAHPAFVKIIGQLSPEEAMILRFVASETIVTLNYLESSTGVIDSIIESNYSIPELQKSNRLNMYLDHLESLNLLQPRSGDATQDNEPDRHPIKENCMIISVQYSLTPFGRLFVGACEP